MAKAVLSLILIILLAAPIVLPQEEFCADGDECCDLPCADCYYHCSCSLGFSALPVSDMQFAYHHQTASARVEFLNTQTASGFVLLPELPPRLS